MLREVHLHVHVFLGSAAASLIAVVRKSRTSALVDVDKDGSIKDAVVLRPGDARA